MKEITRIHLARTPFNAELDAKKELEKYLSAIKKILKADDDTLREIEARIVELLAERGVTGENVITTDDVEKIKEQLGAPSEFIDDQELADVESAGEKRLMRDSEKGILGGVLAGIGAYTGIDTVWLRLIAVVLALLSFGTAVLVYVVLWIAMPQAKTAADKLRMRGEPVTLEALKKQSETVSQEISEKTKPLVVVLRVLLGLGFVATAIGALALVVTGGSIIGIHMSEEAFSVIDVSLVAAFVLVLISGLLFAILCSMLAYASFVWRLNKSMAFSVIAVIIAGLMTFSGAVGLGIYGGKVTEQKIQDMTHTEKVQMNNLTGVKKLVVENGNVPVEYRVTSGSPYAEIQFVSTQDKKPEWSLERKKDIATLSVKSFEDTDCEDKAWYGRLCVSNASVIVYGPSVESIEAIAGQVGYKDAVQSSLTLEIESQATVTLDGGVINDVKVNVADGGTFNAENAAITKGDITVGRDTSVTLGVLAELTLITPDTCGSNSRSYVAIDRVTVLKKVGKTIDQSEEIQENCTTISIDNPSI